MRTNLQLVLTIVFALSTGVLGTLLVQSQSAEAQTYPQQFSECFSATLYGFDGAALPAGPRGWRPPRTVRVPVGWTPVGGLGPQGHHGAVVLCR